ncbi:MAG TPA: hypothetical protein VJB89_04205 [Candidatus Nanoarchaeia archaeon]|nr:hypothetical protein [Candidatus Nanoarchaeia archaeon]
MQQDYNPIDSRNLTIYQVIEEYRGLGEIHVKTLIHELREKGIDLRKVSRLEGDLLFLRKYYDSFN